MAAIEPVQVATPTVSAAYNIPISIVNTSIPNTPQIQLSDITPNLTEGQDFPSGTAGIESVALT